MDTLENSFENSLENSFVDSDADERPDHLWQPLSELVARIGKEGGFVNAHAHFDRAYSVRQSDFSARKVDSHLHEKWQLVDAYKASSSEESYFRHIWAALQDQAEQGVRHCLSFIDVDPVCGFRALNAALRAKKRAAEELQMRFSIACQTLKGVIERGSGNTLGPRDYFEKSLELVDVIGGLPGADKGKEQEHLDVLLDAVKRTGKRAHIHVDQLNSAHEKETEQLCKSVIKWGVEGKVTAVHGISIASHPKDYRRQVYQMCKDAGVSFVSCPSAWIDSRRSEVLQPSHNAITPLDELFEFGIPVALGTDNIADVYKPFSNGDLLTELRILLESCHFYETEELVRVATSHGRLVIGETVSPSAKASQGRNSAHV